MIGLLFLIVGLLWIWFIGYLVIRIPRWFEMETTATWLTRLLLPPLLLIGPFVDEVVGMKQFEHLCRERELIWVSQEAAKVTRAVTGPTRYEELSGYWISIQSRKTPYLDADTGKPFLVYEILGTKGGRIARVALLGGEHACGPPAPNATRYLNLDKLLEMGRMK